MAAYRYHIERRHKLPLDPIKKQKEWEIIQAISESNNVPIKLLQKLYHQTPKRENQRTEQNENKKWTTFTYYSPKIRAVTNIFKNTNLRIAFKTTSTLRQLTRQRQQTPTPDHDRSGIYKIICKSCHKAYVGQTNRSLKTRHQEHTRYIKNNDPRSSYALHIRNNRHEYGNITDTMTLLKGVNRQSLLLPTEQMYIQTLHRNKELIPEQIPNEYNPLFELLRQEHLASHPT